MIVHSSDGVFAVRKGPWKWIEGVPVERNLTGVSFAVANATGILARALEAGAPKGSVEELLKWCSSSADHHPLQ